jgi:HEAT repeat protein
MIKLLLDLIFPKQVSIMEDKTFNDLDSIIADILTTEKSVPEYPIGNIVALGEKVVEPLINIFRYKKISSTLIAMSALEQLDAVALPYLIQALKNGNHLVQTRAISTLEKMRKAEVFEHLAKLIETKLHPITLRATLKALAKLNPIRALPYLIEALSHEEAKIRLSTVEVLNELLSESENETKREILAEIEQQTFNRLLSMVEDEDKNVRYWTIDTLSKIGNQRATEVLHSRLNTEPALDVKRAIVKTLGKLGGENVFEAILMVLQTKNNDLIDWEETELRCQAAQSLGELGDTRAVEPLITVLRDKNHNVRYISIKALGKLGDERALKILTQIKEKEKWGYNDREEQSYPASEAAAQAIEQILEKKALNAHTF